MYSFSSFLWFQKKNSQADSIDFKLCKLMILQFWSLSPVWDYFPDIATWLSDRYSQLNIQNYTLGFFLLSMYSLNHLHLNKQCLQLP